MKKKSVLIDDRKRLVADAEIKTKQGEVKYDLRDFTVDFLVKQYQEDHFYVPPYQREFIWTDKHRCRFIESVLLGLPIPMMFVADMDDGRLEIVDGAQRIRTLECFTSGELELKNLDKLPSLNGFKFGNLSPAQQRKFGNKALRLVVLEDSTSPNTRQEIFDRVNTSGMKAKPSEIRRGAQKGKFMSFISECTKDPLFISLCPITKSLKDRFEDEELILRYLAYADNYKSFRHDVEKFLTQFLKANTATFDRNRYSAEFREMLIFVKKFFPFGFAKAPGAKTTPRVRFEAISVGVTLALRENPALIPPSVSEWIESPEFEKETTTHASNSQPRLKSRVEFVRDRLLGKA